jgi:hypothetical protein
MKNLHFIIVMLSIALVYSCSEDPDLSFEGTWTKDDFKLVIERTNEMGSMKKNFLLETAKETFKINGDSVSGCFKVFEGLNSSFEYGISIFDKVKNKYYLIDSKDDKFELMKDGKSLLLTGENKKKRELLRVEP